MFLDACAAENGSPPRVWGNRQIVKLGGIRVRFTPTCVGKSSSTSASRPASTVHPHVCGEIPLARWLRGVLDGSPPRVWGNPASPGSAMRTWRFTPTCVGKSLRCAFEETPCAVHPHVCGEIRPVTSLHRRLFGSPPRVWGNLTRRAIRSAGRGFTPTCVGKSLCPHSRQRSPTVHPHVCGEILIRSFPKRS